MSTILITHAENFSPEARRVLEEAGHKCWAQPGPMCHPWPESRLHDVLWVRLEPVEIDEEEFPNLKVLATNCTGTDHLPLEECQRRGIRVVSLQDCRDEMDTVHSTAEHTIGLMLSLLRNIPAAVESTKRGEWDRWSFVGRELRGKRVGIVGLGRVGQQLDEHLYGFGCYTEFVDPRLGDFDFAAFLSGCDIVTVHASLNDTSRGMFNAERFAQMKRSAYFINTARGAIVDEAALLSALESGHLAGAALDVVCDEPHINPALVEFADREPGRLLLTPHIGGCTIEGLHATEEILARKLVEVLR